MAVYSKHELLTDCVFCKIIKGDLPCEKIYETKQVIAFLSIAPIASGHTLVVPKKHVVNLLDIDAKTNKFLYEAVRVLCPLIKTALNVEGLNVSINNEPASGQVIMHAHVHIIPRNKDDGLIGWTHHDYEKGEMKKIGDKIRSTMQFD